MPFSEVDFLQALAAGILVGSAYALMCIGLGIIFGSMNVINFAQGDFLMLGMYAAFYLTAGYGVLAFLGPYAGPIAAAIVDGRLRATDALAELRVRWLEDEEPAQFANVNTPDDYRALLARLASVGSA